MSKIIVSWYEEPCSGSQAKALSIFLGHWQVPNTVLSIIVCFQQRLSKAMFNGQDPKSKCSIFKGKTLNSQEMNLDFRVSVSSYRSQTLVSEIFQKMAIKIKLQKGTKNNDKECLSVLTMYTHWVRSRKHKIYQFWVGYSSQFSQTHNISKLH